MTGQQIVGRAGASLGEEDALLPAAPQQFLAGDRVFRPLRAEDDLAERLARVSAGCLQALMGRRAVQTCCWQASAERERQESRPVPPFVLL